MEEKLVAMLSKDEVVTYVHSDVRSSFGEMLVSVTYPEGTEPTRREVADAFKGFLNQLKDDPVRIRVGKKCDIESGQTGNTEA